MSFMSLNVTKADTDGFFPRILHTCIVLYSIRILCQGGEGGLLGAGLCLQKDPAPAYRSPWAPHQPRQGMEWNVAAVPLAFPH